MQNPKINDNKLRNENALREMTLNSILSFALCKVTVNCIDLLSFQPYNSNVENDIFVSFLSRDKNRVKAKNAKLFKFVTELGD